VRHPPPSILALAVLLSACGKGEEDPYAFNAHLPEDLRRGNWSAASTRAPRLTEEQLAAIEELNAIGYADAERTAPALVRVTRYDRERVQNGYNFYTSGHATEAYLVDMNGELVHRWSYDFDELWKGLDIPRAPAGRGKWRRAHLFPNGDILAIHEGIGMIKLDRDSNLLWEYAGQTHHDVHVLPDGSMWTLSRKAEVIPRIHPKEPVMDDLLVELSPEGAELRRVSVLECLENGGESELLARMKDRGELFHTNSIEILDGRGAERVPELAAGNALISLRYLHAVCVVDLEAEAVVWSLTGDFREQHDAKILENGNLLLFDNRGQGEASTVYEFDPATREVVWMYRGTPEEPFYSSVCGTAYRLANGNTLINESSGGRSFEVTPEKEIVWEFYSPHRGGPNLEYIANLFDLQRVQVDWLRE